MPLLSAPAPRAALLLSAALLAACGAPDAPTAAPDAAALAKKPRTTVPNAPTGVGATAGVRQATVTWQVPRYDGGTPILSYRVRASTGQTATVNAPATAATVTGLTAGTPVSFVVVATNAVGDGPASSASPTVTPTGDAPPPPPPPPPGARWLAGYWVGYQRSIHPETEVDFSLLTHVFAGAVLPNADGTLQTHFYLDNTTGPAVARTLATRAHQAGRKAILMLGGAGTHDAMASAASSANRARFVANLVATMDALGYDGIDVDWEPITSTDRAPLLALLQELRAARPAMLLTIPVGWVNTNFPGEVDAYYAQVAAVVDQMNVMTYSMAGPYGGWLSWHTSALSGHKGNTPSSVQSSAARYLAVGVPAAKLGVGIPFYGACWRGVTGPNQTGGSLIAEDNTMSYRNIRAGYGFSARQWDPAAQASYLSFASPTGAQGCQFISYEDEASIAAKGAWLKSAGLGGAIVWTINQGHLGAGQDPLLSAAYQAIVP
ncbi:glycosyl hydrolase family 18 protein [Roseisolibacter sp. H3M3-2]|uniref:glycosyl hydrolase family 18 protein n=1 Tax=Roseisolibacter sp. H3M3-2 TaxID=3031323 RepID=UPI0023D98AE5|nr:glycosyl hydrolase family 18 protein [Roseisolibacter sp. H3M3-2]MDF1502596.1 glycosyl hydrolase family 18 protein [Roseisolibacter sp. H3M3-2]